MILLESRITIMGGNSLVVQWLGLIAFTAGARVQSLLRELRSCKDTVQAKKKKGIAIMMETFYYYFFNDFLSYGLKQKSEIVFLQSCPGMLANIYKT